MKIYDKQFTVHRAIGGIGQAGREATSTEVAHELFDKKVSCGAVRRGTVRVEVIDEIGASGAIEIGTIGH